MLGKCIKNEFVNRSGLVGMISAGVMLFAAIVLGWINYITWLVRLHLPYL